MMLDTQALPFAWRVDGGTTGVATADILMPPGAHEVLRDARFAGTDLPNFAFDELLTSRDATSVLNIHMSLRGSSR